MIDWLSSVSSYSIVDFVPIEAEVYIRLFERANIMLWPLPFIGVLSFNFLLVATYFKTRQNFWRCGLWLILSLSWLLVGFVFFLQLLTELNWIGHYLGMVFITQSIGLLVICLLDYSKAIHTHSIGPFEVAVIFLSFMAYAIVPWLSDRPWQSMEIFAISPNPTCIATLAVLFSSRIIRWWLFIIPSAWVGVSLSLSYAMGLYSGFILLLAMISLLTYHLLYGRINNHTSTF